MFIIHSYHIKIYRHFLLALVKNTERLCLIYCAKRQRFKIRATLPCYFFFKVFKNRILISCFYIVFLVSAHYVTP